MIWKAWNVNLYLVWLKVKILQNDQQNDSKSYQHNSSI
jgi:hypothetical protein